MTQTDKPIHHGRNVKRFREIAELKQEALADMLGAEWSQKKVSIIEAREVLEDDMIEELAKVLKVPTEAIKKMSDDTILQVIHNTYSDFKDNATAGPNSHCSFNPLDEVKRLNAEKDELYKALLKEKDEKIALLERILNSKQ
jgi:transcriptional regulator with XRE-family HTH domain